MKPFKEYTLTDVSSSVSADHAIAELERELAVRQRIYDDWTKQGKIARIDAEDRLCRLIVALDLLQSLAQIPGGLDIVAQWKQEQANKKLLDPAMAA